MNPLVFPLNSFSVSQSVMSDREDLPESISNQQAKQFLREKNEKIKQIKKITKEKRKVGNRARDQRNKQQRDTNFDDYIPFEEKEETFESVEKRDIIQVESLNEEEIEMKAKGFEVEKIPGTFNDFVLVDQLFCQRVQDEIIQKAVEFRQQTLYGSRIKRRSTIPIASEIAKKYLTLSKTVHKK